MYYSFEHFLEFCCKSFRLAGIVHIVKIYWKLIIESNDVTKANQSHFLKNCLCFLQFVLFWIKWQRFVSIKCLLLLWCWFITCITFQRVKLFCSKYLRMIFECSKRIPARNRGTRLYVRTYVFQYYTLQPLYMVNQTL